MLGGPNKENDMRRSVGILGILLVGTLGASIAPTAAQAQTPLADPNLRLRGGVSLVPMPFGSVKAKFGSLEASSGTKFAFGIMPAGDYLINQYFFVGFAPQFTFNVKPKDATGDAGTMVDLLIRVGGNAPVADNIELYGYLAPGYSIVFIPDSDNATGLVLGFHGGAMLDLTPSVFLNLELGYQFGFQAVHDLDFKLSYFQIGLGAGTRF